MTASLAYSRQLLAQARHLATRDRKRPQQVNLRRAVSAAYYSLFHFFIDQSARLLIGGSSARSSMRGVFARAFSHTGMAEACRAFAACGLPAVMSPHLNAIPGDLCAIVVSFLTLPGYPTRG